MDRLILRLPVSRAAAALPHASRLHPLNGARRLTTQADGADRLDQIKPHIIPGISRLGDFVMTSGQGCQITATNGKRFLDFTSGIAVTNTGHCHPKVAQAAMEQCGKLVHGQLGVGYHEPMLRLVDRLLPLVPHGLDTFFFTNSGSEAVESAVKIARFATKKNNIVVFQGSFHGRTYGAMGLTTSKSVYSAGFGPLIPSVFTAPFPYASQMPKEISESQMTDYCLAQFERMLRQQTAPEDTAAVIIEPILGEGGYVAAPEGFLPHLKKICEKHGILFIADEVQTGIGRTGKLFAIEHSGVTPDILVVAKGIASGFPLSGVVSRSAITRNLPPGSMGGTYSGNAVSCAAALATIDVIQEEKLMENAVARGKQLKSALEKLAKRYPVKDVRGTGLMVALEFDETVPAGTAGAISKKVVDHGLLLMSCSIFETLRFAPPLTISASEINEGVQRLQNGLTDVFGK